MFSAIYSGFANFLSTLFSRPWELFAWPVRALLGMSLPARVATLLAVFLWVFVGVAAVIFLTSTELVDPRSHLNPMRVVGILALLFIIPIVVYHALRVWLEGKPSQFPDIDYAWNAGIEELRKKGLAIDQIPVFLVMGAPNDHFAAHLMEGARESFDVESIPEGAAALHWFGNEDNIFIFLTRTSCTSKLASLAEEILDRGGEEPESLKPRAAAASRSIHETMVVEKHDPYEDRPARPEPRSAPAGREAIAGTIMPGAGLMGQLDDALEEQRPRKPIALTPEDLGEQRRRLAYVCKLLRTARVPLSPLNGILALLPMRVLDAGPLEATKLQGAVRSDLTTLVEELQVRCQVIPLIVGMETENGFRELVRRIGIQKSENTRFGKGAELWATPNASQMEALCSHACGAFEDWVYSLFREPAALRNSGNNKLYGLLCKIRRSLQNRLTNILQNGFGVAGDAKGPPPMLIGGCYFAASGPSKEQQAFVRGVLERLTGGQEEMEWLPEAIAADERCRGLARVVMVINVVLALSLVAMIAYKVMYP